ncbi:MAG: ABC transporter substrate-binding protein [Leptospirales bacterium]|nr:ABC transporter substrate-binding protein [Leptospirales bacterium]
MKSFVRVTRIIRLAALGSVLLFAIACGKHKIGVSLPLSGEKAESGKAILQSLQMGVEEMNANGGARGRKIELVVKDDANDPVKSKQISEEFATDKSILAVIGHYDDSVAMAGIPAYDKNGLVILSPSVGGKEFIEKSPWAFSGTYPLGTQMKMLSAYLKVLEDLDRVLVIKATSTFGRVATEEFVEATKIDGITTTIAEGFNDKKPGLEPDFVQKTIPNANSYPAIVILAHAMNADQLIKQLRDGGFKGQIFGADRLATGLIPKLKKLTEEGKGAVNYSEKIHIGFPFMYTLGSLKGMRFADRYMERYKAEPTIWAGFAYDGLDLIVRAINEKGPSREGIKEWLTAQNSYDEGLEGVSGRVFFADGKNAVGRELVMSRISSSGSYEPAFRQIRQVRDSHNLRQVPAKVAAGEMLMSAGIPYFKINVVFVGLDFEKINNVDIKAQRFEIEGYMWYRWIGDVAVEGIGFKNGDMAAENTMDELRKKMGDGLHSENWVSYKVRQTLVFPFDLVNFPFDVQHLPMVIAHKTQNANKLMIAIDREKLSDAHISEIYPQEWEYLRRKDFAGTFKIDSVFGNPSYKPGDKQAAFSMYEVRLSIVRILSPYLNSFFIPLFVLLVIGFLVSALPLSQIDARLALVMTALLSVIVFQMAMASNLPSVGYSMRTDIYFMISYLFLFALVGKTLLVNRIFNEGNGDAVLAKKIENYFTFLAIPVAVIAYAIVTISAVMARMTAMVM